MEQEIKASVFKQFTFSLVELGKTMLKAGATVAMGLLYPIITAQRWPTKEELHMAADAGLMAMAGIFLVYWLNPTRTVIQGQYDPKATVNESKAEVKVTDQQPE